MGGHGGVGVGDDDEVVRVAVARDQLLVDVGRGLAVVVDLHPVGVELAVPELAIHLDGVETGLAGDGARRQLPDALGDGAMLRIVDHQVGWQAMGEGAHLARGAAGRGLPGQREGAIAWGGDLAGQQMQVVDQVVGPDAAGVLVEAHGPKGHDPDVGVGVQLGQGVQLVPGHARDAAEGLGVVPAHELGIVLEADVLGAAGIVGVGGRPLQGMLGAQAVAYVGVAQLELGVFLDELLVDRALLDDVAGDVVGDGQI